MQTISSGANNAGTAASTTGAQAGIALPTGGATGQAAGANTVYTPPAIANNAQNTSGAGTGAAVNYNAPTTQYANTGTSADYQAQINAQLGQLNEPVTGNNNVVQAQTNAYNTGAERNLEGQDNAIAEANYAGGNTNTGATGQQEQQAREATALGEGQNQAGAIQTQQAAQTQEKENLLGLGTQAGLTQQGITAGQTEAGNQLGLGYGQLQQNEGQFTASQGQQAGQFGVTTAQQQEAIQNQLAEAEATNRLGYAGVDLGYYNTQQGVNSNLAENTLNNQTSINNAMASGS